MKTTLVGVLVDETGSMAPTKERTISGVNEYLEGLSAEDGLIKVTLVTFNAVTGPNARCACRPPSLVPRLTASNYRPNANTPLLDAVASLILDMERQASKFEDPRVVAFIVTDGEENASREWTNAALLALIKAKQEQGWAFAYLGADHDAFSQAGSLGVGQLNTVTYTKGQEEEAWKKLRVATVSYAVGQTTSGDLFSTTTGGGNA